MFVSLPQIQQCAEPGRDLLATLYAIVTLYSEGCALINISS